MSDGTEILAYVWRPSDDHEIWKSVVLQGGRLLVFGTYTGQGSAMENALDPFGAAPWTELRLVLDKPTDKHLARQVVAATAAAGGQKVREEWAEDLLDGEAIPVLCQHPWCDRKYGHRGDHTDTRGIGEAALVVHGYADAPDPPEGTRVLYPDGSSLVWESGAWTMGESSDKAPSQITWVISR